MSLHPGTILSPQISGHCPLQWLQPNAAHPLCALDTFFLSFPGPRKTMWSLSRPFPQGVSSYSNSPLSGAWEERPLLPPPPHTHTHPPPRSGLPRTNSSLPSGLTPSRPLPPPPPPLFPGLAIPGAPSRGNPEERKEKGRQGGSRLSGILPDASEPPESVKQRLPLSGLA